METYSLLRQFADSWMLLALFIFFLGTWVWAFRPGSRRVHEDAANTIFRHEDAPAEDDGDRSQDATTDPEGPK
ncbi:MAG: cbb3-type cytochrome c oxidase subunit 3 [Salibaculum sp.]|jgi:cytochrome c oxidase cbb3-type subunit 4|uniref:cbb3-type cytochrome c oxidase subunit 3 n=1 Tax=Salibaculum sp. TaxID=2855480 RepID=UPI002870528C|nr:cbb3-type cytochrome c oxidase subunit 3 [Salibaculum sp.]MDR9428515.1 cbb3-type cytochrome c oxidase subunit 3 [Salibaculum sp.]MDR9482588.1 cbb3-type cytochrome c oxidase subunit 3 [Salibaculum sp.]